MRVWTNGCFDIIHRGHIEMLKYARSLGNYLVVGIDSDARVKASKGTSRPINSLSNRKFVLEALKSVDKVVVFNSDEELAQCIQDNDIDIMVVGSDWKGKQVIGEQYAKELKFFGRLGAYSTTNILERAK